MIYSGNRATRRFYNAFYSWSRLDASPSCRRFVTIRPHPAADRYVPPETDSSLSSDQTSGTRIRQSDYSPQRIRNDKRTEANMRKHIQKSPMLSSTEKPFDTFKAWEHVVRYRSDSGALLQVAVPHSAVRYMQRKGRNLLNGLERYAKIELGHMDTMDGRTMQSVALSGTYLELNRTLARLLEYQEPEYLLTGPVSYSKRPSASLESWEKVLRSRESQYCEVEVSIPYGAWQTIERTNALDGMKKRWGAHIDIGSSTSRVPADSSGAKAVFLRLQSVLVSGDPLEVHFTIKDLMMHKVLESQASAENTEELSNGDEGGLEGGATTSTSVRFMDLSVPIDPTGKNVARKVALKMQGSEVNECRMKVEDEGASLRIEGPTKATVEETRRFVQDRVDMSCGRMRSSPPKLEVVKSGVRKVEQKPMPDSASSTPDRSRNQNASQTVQENRSEGVAGANSSESMRLALRALSNPVILVTTQVPHGPTDHAKRDTVSDRLPFCRGLTVSSFSSITLEPDAMVSFNIRVPSRTWNAMSDSGNLVAHFLAASPSGAALAHEFTRPHERPDEAFWNLRRMGAFVTVPRDGKSAPRIRFKDAVLATLRATLDKKKCVPVGDHMIVVAKVEQVEFPDEAEKKRLSEGDVMAKGLTYAQRGYRSTGREIKPMTMEEAQSQIQQASAVSSETQDVSLQAEQEAALQLDEETIGGLSDGDVDSNPWGLKCDGTTSPEQTDIDYFQAIEEDEFEPSEEAAAQSTSLNKDAVQEEEEYDFGFAADEDDDPVGIGIGQQKEPLVEDSAAAREEEEAKASGAARSPQVEKAEEQDGRGETQKRPFSTTDGP